MGLAAAYPHTRPCHRNVTESSQVGLPPLLTRTPVSSQVGLATAAAIVGMPPAGTQLTYSGPIVSGAVIGAWTPVPLPEESVGRLSVVRG